MLEWTELRTPFSSIINNTSQNKLKEKYISEGKIGENSIKDALQILKKIVRVTNTVNGTPDFLNGRLKSPSHASLREVYLKVIKS